MNRYFVDWCPRPTTVKIHELLSKSVSQKHLPRSVRELIKVTEITYWIRGDGNFIFVMPELESAKGQAIDEMDIVKKISGTIKEQNGHIHLFDSDRHKEKTAHFPTLTISPIEVTQFSASCQHAKDTRTLDNTIVNENFGSDEKLTCFLAPPRLNSTNRTNLVPAVYLVRAQFGKIFERTQRIKERYQELRFLKFRVFGFGHIALIYVLSVLALTSFQTTSYFVMDESSISIKENAGTLKEFAITIAQNNLALLIPALVLVYIVNVSIKRQKILQAIRRARGFMKFGSIFCQILNDAGKSVPDYVDVAEFQNCDEILSSMEDTENRKRAQTQTTLLFFALLAGMPTVIQLKARFPEAFDLIELILALR